MEATTSFSAITIRKAISKIDAREYLIPSIQREFTWWEDQIRWLFDSLMQGYPINSFLFWEVVGETKKKFVFYEFMKNYVEKHKIHSDEFSTTGHPNFHAILDGQQRLSSLYLGLKGSFAWHKPHSPWIDSRDNFPPRRLYLNVSRQADKDDEENQVYFFKWLTEGEFNAQENQWFLAGEILEVQENELFSFIDSHSKLTSSFGKEVIFRLWNVVHKEAIVNYYLERDQNIDKALNIFIRTNKGGTPLSISDLIMSVVTSHWKSNAKEAVSGLKDEVFRNMGFTISKEFALKSYLYLYSEDIRYKVSNFSATASGNFESRWEDLRTSILMLFRLARRFGFTDHTLSSHNALLPILYYVHHAGISKAFDSEVRFVKDREVVKRWLHIVLLKQALGTSADSILKTMRTVFTDDPIKQPINRLLSVYPAKEIIERFTGEFKNLTFDDSVIDALLRTQKDGPNSFSILALLYPNLDFQNGNFHKDHLHPATLFTDESLASLDVTSDRLGFFRDRYNWNSILNLQLLDSNENKSKNDGDLQPWVEKEAEKLNISAAEFCSKRLIPASLDLKDFESFIKERKVLLSEELKRQVQMSKSLVL